jgi:thioredoxin-like negative regulator of GroEL
VSPTGCPKGEILSAQREGSPVRAWLTLHEGHFHRHVQLLPGRTLVLFSQPGCAACRRAEAFLPGWLAGLVQQCVKVDAQEQAALAREFEVFHLPALHLYLDGRYHAPVLCPLAEAAVRTAVGQVIADPAVEAP